MQFKPYEPLRKCLNFQDLPVMFITFPIIDLEINIITLGLMLV